MSEEYEFADIATHLEVNPEEWFEWPEKKRDEYALKFSKISDKIDVLTKKNIALSKQYEPETTRKEWKEFSD